MTTRSIARWMSIALGATLAQVGVADLLPGSGHGWGGFVNVGRIEVYGRPVAR